MAKVIDNIRICTDCLLFAANGDLPDDTERAEEVLQGFDNAGGHVVPCGESEEFSWSPCDCCRTALGGARHSAVILNQDSVQQSPPVTTEE